MSGRSSLQNQILLVLAAGFVAGTFFVNFPGREYIGQFGIFSQDYREQILGGQLDMWGLFFYLLARRLAPLFFLVLFSYSRWKEPLLFLILLWMAFSLGICWFFLSDSLSGERNSSVLWFLPAAGNPLCDRLGGNHTKPLSLSQAQQRFLRSGADPGDGSGIRSLDSSASAAHPVRIFLLLNGD